MQRQSYCHLVDVDVSDMSAAGELSNNCCCSICRLLIEKITQNVGRKLLRGLSVSPNNKGLVD